MIATEKNLLGSAGATGKRGRSKKSVALQVTVSREDFATYAEVSARFGVKKEVLMESAVSGQMLALGDDTFANLTWIDDSPDVVDGIVVTLRFIPDEAALLHLVARLLKRPLDLLTSYCLRMDALSFSSDMEAGAKGSDYHLRELASHVKGVIVRESEVRQGRMERDHNGLDGWERLALEHLRPAAVPNSRAKKGGSAK